MKKDTSSNQGGISRRDLFKLGSVAALGAAGTGVLAGCSTPKSTSTSTTTTTASSGKPSFLTAPAAIKDIKATKQYDVVVVGAGAAGVPAALSARELGVSVAVLQKESQAISQGNTGTGIDLAASDPAGVQALVARLSKDCQHRSTRALLEVWAQKSGEAVAWVIKRSLEGGASVVDQKNAQAAAVTTVNGYTLSYVTSFFGPKPLNTGDGIRALASVAQKEGVEFFYSTPAVQLVKEGDKVIGVIGKNADGTYTQFNASKGVILATGDYQNDEEMCDYYLPDIHNFERKQMNKTGDGHKMGVWAGGKIEDINHTKMLHDFDAGPATMCDMPFMVVNDKGERFVNEAAVEMSLLNNYLRQADRTGWYTQVFDSKYTEFAAKWPGVVIPPAGLKNYMPDDPGEKKGVFSDLVRTFECNTLDELAAKLEIDPATFKKSVARYNEMVAAGKDSDFGVPADKLFPISTPPFYGIHRHLRVSAIVSGLEVDENSQCLTPEGKQIPGLFAAGNCAGKFYGGVDYPMTLPGLSLGRAYTFGRVVGQYVAKIK